MQILIKALNGRQFKVELDPEKTVLDLKQDIQKNEGADYNVDSQKLIYEGKILANSSKLSEYKIDPKKFLVLLITRPPPPKKLEELKPTTESASKKDDSSRADKKAKDDTLDKTTTSSSSNVGSLTRMAAQGQAPSTGAPTSTSTTTTTTTTTSTTPQTASNQQNPNVARSRTSTSAPMRASSGPPVRTTGLVTRPEGAESNLAGRLSHLMSLPHFANLQTTLHQNPHLLSSAIESLSTADPEMYQFVSENPDIFLSALNTPSSALNSHRDQMRSSSGRQRRTEPPTRAQALVSGGGGGGGAEQLGLSHMLPSATDHDKQAIERLKELGFSEFQAIQAYVACDKDEQLAANLLFSMDQ